LEDLHKKMISGRKQHFWAQKGPLWAIGAMKRPGPDFCPFWEWAD